MKALVVVAHPDDETIWMGGTILTHKNWKWTIISLCRKDDVDRMPKFNRVCEAYGARGIISDLDDEKLLPLQTEEVIAKIRSLLPEKAFDYIYTHGKNGEYGHLRHKEVHKAMKTMINNKEILCKQDFYFSYKPSNLAVPSIPGLKLALPDPAAHLCTNLDDSLLAQKINIITRIYGFTPESFEALSCNKMEAFVHS